MDILYHKTFQFARTFEKNFTFFTKIYNFRVIIFENGEIPKISFKKTADGIPSAVCFYIYQNIAAGTKKYTQKRSDTMIATAEISHLGFSVFVIAALIASIT